MKLPISTLESRMKFPIAQKFQLLQDNKTVVRGYAEILQPGAIVDVPWFETLRRVKIAKVLQVFPLNDGKMHALATFVHVA